jgi:hypothetical protein
VRKELKFAYQGLLNTSVTPTNGNYSMNAGLPNKGGNASTSYMLPHSQVYSDSLGDVESRGGKSHTPVSQKDRVLRSSLKKPTSQNGEMSPNVQPRQFDISTMSLSQEAVLTIRNKM